jgi:Raf kinase inhibitor-like YbhB/YbcL family protein
MRNSALIWLSLLLFAPVLANAGQFILSSESFADGTTIPLKYARNGINGGKNISPQINWKNPPERTKSFALICVDIAPVANNWIHWEIFNIPADIHSIKEGASCKNMPPGSIENFNSFGDRGYSGPQPLEGSEVHTYVFTIYALNFDKITSGEKFYNYDQFLKLLNGRILGQISITGTFINELH